MSKYPIKHYFVVVECKQHISKHGHIYNLQYLVIFLPEEEF